MLRTHARPENATAASLASGTLSCSVSEVCFIHFKALAGNLPANANSTEPQMKEAALTDLKTALEANGRSVDAGEGLPPELGRRTSRPAGLTPHDRAEAQVHFVVAARQMREALIGKDLFADPAWDMLLQLYAAFLSQRRISTGELILASGVPSTTGLRWIQKLELVGLENRAVDPLDGRRVWAEISEEGALKMRILFDTIAWSS